MLDGLAALGVHSALWEPLGNWQECLHLAKSIRSEKPHS